MKVAYLFITFPTLSQTFLQREIAGVAATGVTVEVHSMWTPSSGPLWPTPPGVTVHSWRPFDLFHPTLVATAFRHRAALSQAIGLRHNYHPRSWEDRKHALLGLLFALRHAAYFRSNQFDLIHGAWATAPATAAAVLGKLCDLPFSFGAHAYDIHRNGGDLFLPYKLERAALVHTTTQMNLDYLSGIVPTAKAKIVLARRGLPELPSLLSPPPLSNPIRLLSVGRLIPKKGQLRQIEAIALLKASGCATELRIVGEGPLHGSLAAAIATHGLEREVRLLGALSEAEVKQQYAWADLFCHSGQIGADGDRDGLPNVIPEAMAHGVPVISSDAAGTTEAVQHQVTGWIAPNGTAEAIVEAVRRLAADSTLRERLRRTAHAWVEENFLIEKNAERLAKAFAQAAGTSL